jgi:hypothetical protein
VKENKNILNNLNKRQKPEAPKDFFENFSDNLMAKISESDSGLTNFKKTTKPDVPVGFFESFAKDITQQTNDQIPIEQDQPTRIIRMKVMGFVSAVAACLLVMFLVMPTDDKELANTNTENEVRPLNESISDEDLMAYVDADDIIDYILDENIEIGNSDENSETTKVSPSTSSSELEDLGDEDIFYFLEDDIDDLYFDDFEL